MAIASFVVVVFFRPVLGCHMHWILPSPLKDKQMGPALIYLCFDMGLCNEIINIPIQIKLIVHSLSACVFLVQIHKIDSS